jgi:hypothetical protein
MGSLVDLKALPRSAMLISSAPANRQVDIACSAAAMMSCVERLICGWRADIEAADAAGRRMKDSETIPVFLHCRNQRKPCCRCGWSCRRPNPRTHADDDQRRLRRLELLCKVAATGVRSDEFGPAPR